MQYIIFPIILVNDQFDAQFLYFITRLLQSSTCFEQRRAHCQEVNCINTASGIVTLCKCNLQRVTIPDAVLIQFDLLMSHLQRVTIPDAVLVQFNLLMMSTTLLETCRGL